MCFDHCEGQDEADLPGPLDRRCCGASTATDCHQMGLCLIKGDHPESVKCPTPTDVDEVERVARHLADRLVTLVGYEAKTPMTATGLLSLESARSLARAALAALGTAADGSDRG